MTFDISSDYQQNKPIPAQRDLLQTGPTYYLTAETFFLHIFFANTLGVGNRPTKLGRIIVYTQCKEAADAKTCNETISTLVDLLFGYWKPQSRSFSLYGSV